MPDIDLGAADDWEDGDFHGRVKLTQSKGQSNPAKKDVVVGSPVSIELLVNTNLSSSQEADKIYFTAHHGSTKKVIAVIDSDGHMSIAGKVFPNQGYLT
ncbi:hypothetical protein EV562_10335 [Streptomyces sp. BK208]|uniref:DUF6342 family protein n=1 Tax=Streptomyces sp. BK208 TaxID=2512150 RepID=UPI00105CADA0|nr:DUF6342 family protein [Streptomyces sp. BK208]TDT39665.1 hypothetical protein EV562_10335 [Streptomyces sp. BK208]